MAREVRLRASRTPYRRAGLVLSGSPLVIALVELTGAQLAKLVRDPVVTVEAATGDGAWVRAQDLGHLADDAELEAAFDAVIALEREQLGLNPDPAAESSDSSLIAAAPLAADASASAAPSTDAAAPADDTNTQRESPAATDASAPAGGAPEPSTGAGVVAAAAADAAEGGDATQAAPAEAQQEATTTPPVVEMPKPAAKPTKATKPKAPAARKGGATKKP